jgi:hypothetical protein
VNYKTYAEAKIANPDCEIVTTGKNLIYDKELTGTFQPRVTEGCSHAINDYSWVICNHADYCSTLKEFLEAGLELVEGDKFIEVSGCVYNVDSDDLNLVNERDSGDCDRYILSSAALNGGRKIPAKVEQWTIYNNTLPLSELSDEQAAQLFNAWRGDGEVECKGLSGEFRPTYELWCVGAIYRIKQKSKRELFIETSAKLMTSETERTMEQMFGAQFDAGARYTDLTQHFGENI